MYVFEHVLNAMTSQVFAVVAGGAGSGLKSSESLKTKKSNLLPKKQSLVHQKSGGFLECDRQKRSKLENILHSRWIRN
jgi:hypothetical protein